MAKKASDRLSMTRHGKVQPGKTTMTFVLPMELKQQLAALAKREKRTMGNLVVTVLAGWVAGKG
jgi:hypothetical protein